MLVQVEKKTSFKSTFFLDYKSTSKMLYLKFIKLKKNKQVSLFVYIICYFLHILLH